MPLCPKCDYDLAAHELGERCPECGMFLSRFDPEPPPLWTGVSALCLVLVLPLLFLFVGREPALTLLIGALSLHAVLVVGAFLQYRGAGTARFRTLLVLGTAAGVVPLLTLVLFLRVFVFGGSSNVAQLAGNSGTDLWSLWFEWWPILLFGNPLSAIVALAALAVPPYRVRYIGAWALPLAALIAALAGAYLAGVYFPDA